MKRVNLLDCTLRDGGYVNDWLFGEECIRGTLNKLAQTGIELIEVGFLKGTSYEIDRTLFPNIASFSNIMESKRMNISYVGMLDMSAPVSMECITFRTAESIDGIRVIFKKNKMKEAYNYCRHVKDMGYDLYVNFVSTDQYTDREFIDGLAFFADLHPTGVTIVDTFGMIKKKEFSRLVMLADNNLAEDITLCYHAHNNLQQAFENAQTMVEMNLKRDICIDACVFGMGRGAGNLNLELFAGFMNDNYGTNYQIAPMLEIMDEYLKDFYQTKFWGYSLPLYLSASHGCHPNYAIFLAERQTLSVKAFNELLQRIPDEDKRVFSKTAAEKYYREYLEQYVDDKRAVGELTAELKSKSVLLLAPGKTLETHKDIILQEIEKSHRLVVAINFIDDAFPIEYVFTSNMRRYTKLPRNKSAKVIATSNISDSSTADYVVNFTSYTSSAAPIVDNAGLMSLHLLQTVGVTDVCIAGMDGYSAKHRNSYLDMDDVSNKFTDYELRNQLIGEELSKMKSLMNITMLTPTKYEVK